MKQICTMMFSLFIANPIFTKSFFLHKNSINNCVKNGIIIKNSFVHYSKKSGKHKNNEFSQIEKNTRTGNNEKEEIYKPKTENQEKYCKYLNDHRVSIVFAVGPAGTGKTILACNDAIKQLKNGKVKKIIITRPVISVDDEEIGFLPGNINKKMEPWSRPIFDIFTEYFYQNEIQKMVTQNTIEIAPLAYMRGRTFKNTYIIADEMQNSSPSQMMMLTTRIGYKSKMIITGDLKQNDRKNELSGLVDFIEKYKKYKSVNVNDCCDYIKIIELNKYDIERSPVVAKILDIYAGHTNVKDLPNLSQQSHNISSNSICFEYINETRVVENDASLIPSEPRNLAKVNSYFNCKHTKY